MAMSVRKSTDDAVADTEAPVGGRGLRRDLDPLISALARAVSRQSQARPQAQDMDRPG